RRLEVRDREDRARACDREARHQLWVCPPSATIISPVTQPASSEARKATAGAMSAGMPRRGIACSICTKSKASACGLARTPADAVRPVATELTVMPSLPSSRAAARVKDHTPPFDATYCARVGSPARMTLDAMLTMRPYPASRIGFSTALMVRNTPSRLTDMI